ncbi:hypothetical protein CDD81_3491 [Ophiocordyceps australis]|uniref:LysM domain-containing protein n=1 Tax=Ophiocordyceps australis TaxID=1399860 RepID=A0A2C5YBV1_9HYPO|nr:hypothetical protein CDD81_3491 [Ophiocordyceps australis]
MMPARLMVHGAFLLLFANRVLSSARANSSTLLQSTPTALPDSTHIVPSTYSQIVASIQPAVDTSRHVPSAADETLQNMPRAASKPTKRSECLGIRYTVQAGDSCNSISHSSKVATDRIVELNHLDYDCATLTPGIDLCLEGPCELHVVGQNDTCASIVGGRGFSRIQLVSWNP